MTPELALREKLRKIEALFAGAGTAGERIAAGAAADRIRERLDQATGKEQERLQIRSPIKSLYRRAIYIFHRRPRASLIVDFHL